MGSDTGWFVGAGGGVVDKGKFNTHNKRFCKKVLLFYKKVGEWAFLMALCIDKEFF